MGYLASAPQAEDRSSALSVPGAATRLTSFHHHKGFMKLALVPQMRKLGLRVTELVERGIGFVLTCIWPPSIDCQWIMEKQRSLDMEQVWQAGGS